MAEAIAAVTEVIKHTGLERHLTATSYPFNETTTVIFLMGISSFLSLRSLWGVLVTPSWSDGSKMHTCLATLFAGIGQSGCVLPTSLKTGK